MVNLTVLGRFFDFIITSGSGVLSISKIAEPLASGFFKKKFSKI